MKKKAIEVRKWSLEVRTHHFLEVSRSQQIYHAVRPAEAKLCK